VKSGFDAGAFMIDLRNPLCDPAAVRQALDLAPHPEGGHYREVWRDRPASGGRGAASSILFLLESGERSRWHRVDAAELWLWQAGAPLALGVCAADGVPYQVRLGPDLSQGETLQHTVPVGAWQDARSLGRWTLVSCVVAPAFEFAGFEMAPEGWAPGGSR
jgi:predicted cupin superfamily sugar epimerase